MGFGSYDETEQERQQYDTDVTDAERAVDTSEHSHDGRVEYEFDTTNDELLARLREATDE